jgi:hypothetical protein
MEDEEAVSERLSWLRWATSRLPRGESIRPENAIENAKRPGVKCVVR